MINPRTRKGRNHSNLSLLLEKTAFYGLLITILLSAIPYGTVDPWFKSLFIVCTCFFGMLRITYDLLTQGQLVTDFTVFLPLFGILLLALIQIFPYQNYVISLDPYETKSFIFIFTSLLVTGEILFRFSITEHRLRYLIYLVLTVGLGSAIFGLIRLFFLDESNVLSPLIDDQVQFAQFVNRNHFAFLMEMTLGLLIGLVLKTKFPSWLQPLSWLAIAAVSFAIISTNSRGGILSATGLILLAFLIHFFTKEKKKFDARREQQFTGKSQFLKRVLAAAMLTFAVFIIAFYTIAFVGGDTVVNRIETIQTEISGQGNSKIDRLDIWKSTIEMIKARPLIGTGFGAYSAGITLYDKSVNKFALKQAHNDYLEILANGGILAFLLMLVFMAILTARFLKQFQSIDSFRKGSCFGAAMGIFGVMLHSVSDFGLHIIVNALIFIVLMVIATAEIRDPEKMQQTMRLLRQQ